MLESSPSLHLMLAEQATPPALPMSLAVSLPVSHGSQVHQTPQACQASARVGRLQDEYRKHIEKDPALERRFQQVYVSQPSVVDTISILRGLKDR